MTLVAENYLKLRVVEVNVLFLFLQRSATLAIASTTGRELLEFHDICSQCTCFVGKYVFNLSQLFIEVTSLRPHLHVLLLVIHCDIVTHKQRLPKFDDLEGHIQ